MTQNTFVQSPTGGHTGQDVNILSGNPLPVYLVDDPATSTPQVITAVYNQITSVASGVLTSIASYTVPLGETFYLIRIEFGGSNIATYNILKNGVNISTKRTYFGGGLSDTVTFEGQPNTGFKFNQSEVVAINTIHQRPDLGDFEATIIGLLVG